MSECVYEMIEGTCSICKVHSVVKTNAATLDFNAIKTAVEELGEAGAFRTKQVATHAAVSRPYPQQQADPRFAQHIGSYLTGALGTLGIVQVSRKGVANATWQVASAAG